MKNFTIFFTILFLSICANIAMASNAGMLNNEVVLTVTQCDSTLGSGNFFAEIFGTDTSGAVHDYTLQQSNGNFVFQDVVSGVYEIAVYRVGLKLYRNENVAINSNYQENIVLQQNLLPPDNFSFDVKSLVASWENPEVILLNEDFEDTTFPPANWQNQNFIRGNDSLYPSIDSWPSFFAVAPSHNTKSQTAYLITPAVDLRQSSHFYLSFDCFFRAQYGELFTLEYSLDEGATWSTLQTLTPYPTWENKEIDISFLSGVGGKRSVMFKFTFEFSSSFPDHCAIDNVKIYDNEIPPPDTYSVFLDNQLDNQVSGNILSDTLSCLDYGEQHQVAIIANYVCGISNTLSESFLSKYLPMVKKTFFTYTYGASNVEFQLHAEDKCDTLWQNDGLLEFKLFRDGDSLTDVPYEPDSGSTMFASDNPNVNGHQYCVKAVYDLSYWGYPGQTSQSAAVCDSVFVAYGKTLPFTENWSSANFELNNWIADSGVEIDNQNGNPAPSVVFSNDAKNRSYQQNLVSDNMLTDLNVGAVWLDYDIKLEDTATYSNQNFTTQIINANNAWHTVETLNGTPDFGWESRHLDVTYLAEGMVTAFRFIVTGNENNHLRKWFVDNIKLFRTCQVPDELYAGYIWDGTFGVMMRWHYKKSNNINENKGLQGFNIYRKSNNMNNYELYDFVPYSIDGYFTYYDMAPAVVPQTGYFYKVDALYVSENDSLESQFAHAYYQPDDDFVYVFITGEKETIPENNIIVYPNPAKDVLFITAPVALRNITLFNNRGGIVFSKKNVHFNKIQINVSRFASGIYFLRLEENGKAIYNKVVITH